MGVAQIAGDLLRLHHRGALVRQRSLLRRLGCEPAELLDGVAQEIGLSPRSLDFGTVGQPETFVVSPDGVLVCGASGPSTQAALDTWLLAARTGRQCG